MSLYQTVKSAITVRQVGEMYGMEPDRHGMVCCPFHSDSDPSMKLNDTYYYCFGCGANGDAIDLTAKLFDLNPRQAAEKLNDFAFAKQCSPQWGLQATERSCAARWRGLAPTSSYMFFLDKHPGIVLSLLHRDRISADGTLWSTTVQGWRESQCRPSGQPCAIAAQSCLFCCRKLFL